MIQLFASEADWQALTSVVHGADADASADAALALAWYWRQARHTEAQALARRAAGALRASDSSARARRMRARLRLLQAETAWLESQCEAAEIFANDAMMVFTQVQDALGCADCHHTLANIHSSTGQLLQRDAALEQAVVWARMGQDAQRLDFLQASQARYAVLRDVQVGQTQWQVRFGHDTSALHPYVAASVHAYFAALAYNTGDFGSALGHFNRAFDHCLQSGQSVSAVVAAVNAGSAYVVLNDHEAALEWLQRGMDLARPHAWAIALGPCLRQTGEVMRAMGRLDAAQALLDEALDIYQPLRQSRNFIMLLSALGDLSQDRGDHARALEFYEQKAQRAEDLQQADAMMEAELARGNALLRLGQTPAAQRAAQTTLNMARTQGAVLQEIGAQRLLSSVCQAQGDAPGALQYLEQALATARGVEGYRIPEDLLQTLGEAYAAAGDFERAYTMAVQASQARERVFSQEASNRATAIQIRINTERARAESEQHRRQAEAEARRAALLQQTSDTLERLGAVGQEITSQLDKESVFAAIERHVHGLLDASSFAIYLMDPDGLGLTSVYDIEEGQRLAADHVQLDNPKSYSARCVRERQELLVDFTDPTRAPLYVPGTLATLSALFAPLTIGERVLGVMTIQSTREGAYGDNERLIFRTLCAYAAIALDNAVAYSHLRDAKDQLVVQEKLAALGALVAGVAHELNTPLGNSLLTITALQDQARDLERAVQDGTLRRSTLSGFVSASLEGLDLAERGLKTAGELVQSFKQVAVDRATEQRRAFDLLRTSQEIVATLARNIQRAGHRLELDIPPDLVLDGYPGPYGQVLTNLVNNALLHAFEVQAHGTMTLRARPWRADQVEIVFCDDGVGISAANLKRIFDPFFTTKMGQGGSGLGLSICYNIVTVLFGGELKVESRRGDGTHITLRLPLRAPEPSANSHFADSLYLGLGADTAS